ncbi:MAG: trigger factor [candidate division Zixibacteria bacterium RBG_16_50_21]|nr:MAG: trigger factor [candidate division Zixibacteria bacterium RBG_16_50_21]
MKVNVKTQEGWKKVLEIEVPKEKVFEEFEQVFLKLQKEAKIPGFRPGKVPLELVKTRFKDAASEEVLESLLNSSYRQAIEETKLNPVSYPKVKDVNFPADGPLSFKAEVEVQPEIEVKDYKELRLSRRFYPVQDKEVDDAVLYLRERNAELKPVEREIREKDFVVADVVEHFTQNGKQTSQKYDNQLLEIDPELMLKEFKEALVGGKIGDEKSFTTEYPKEHANKRLAGQKVSYKLKVNEVKEKNLPDLDDNFAKAQGDYQTLLELRLKVRESLEKRHQEETSKELESQIIARIVEKNSFTVPEGMINSYLDYLVEDLKKRYPESDEKEIREKNRKPGEERIRWEFIYHKIADAERIAVKPEDVEERVKNFAAAYNLPLDKAQEYLGQTKQIERMQETILEEKVLEWLISQAEIKEERKDK